MRNRKTYSRLAFAGAVMSALAPLAPAVAATQGTLGATSQGQITINASVPKQAQISGLTDIDLTNSNPNNAAVSSQNTCVWSNTATKGYSIVASGSGASSAFTLANGSLTVPYSVAWAATSAASSGTAMTAGTALTGLTTTATKPTCSSSPTTTSTLIVTIAASDLQSMTAVTTYTGTLTLLVTPN
jgi:hypothetical protein